MEITNNLDNITGMVKAKTIQFQQNISSFTDDIQSNNTPDSRIVNVLIKLVSVEHIADRDVNQIFDLQLTVSDENSINMVSQYIQSNTSIPGGSILAVNESLPSRNYPTLFATRIRFTCFVKTQQTFGFFTGVTEGDEALSPGVNLFTIPIVLKVGNAKSTLLFKGRVDVTVFEGS